MNNETIVAELSCEYINDSGIEFEKVADVARVVARVVFDTEATVLTEDTEQFALTDKEENDLIDWLRSKTS